tara:strand:- start:316 stop:537 length:222 start_codon:yes stop_codon:yes gene_type:complete
MKNKVMNYKEFMAVCNSCGTIVKSNISNKDAKTKSSVNQGMNSDIIKGKNTSHLDRFTKAYKNTVKGRSIVKK